MVFFLKKKNYVINYVILLNMDETPIVIGARHIGSYFGGLSLQDIYYLVAPEYAIALTISQSVADAGW